MQKKQELTKEFLEKLYVNEGKSLREIGNLVNKSPSVISRYFKKLGIKTRPFSTKGLKTFLGKHHSEATKEKLRKAHTGKKLSPEHRNKVIKTLRYGLKGKENPAWKGGKYQKSDSHYQDKRGWIYLRKPDHPNCMSNGYVAEHRYVMSNHIGRPLTKFEHIHHLNGIKTDNRIENLELINGQTHNLITMLEKRVRELEAENKVLREKFNQLTYFAVDLT